MCSVQPQLLECRGVRPIVAGVTERRSHLKDSCLSWGVESRSFPSPFRGSIGTRGRQDDPTASPIGDVGLRSGAHCNVKSRADAETPAL